MLETLWGLVLANTGHPAVSQTWCSNRQHFPRKEVSQPDRGRDKIGICHLSLLEKLASLCFALTECITDVRLAWRRHAATQWGYGSSEAGVSRQFLGEYWVHQFCLWRAIQTFNCFDKKNGNNSHRKSSPLKKIFKFKTRSEVHNVYYRNNLKIITPSLHKIKCADSIFPQCGIGYKFLWVKIKKKKGIKFQLTFRDEINECWIYLYS